MNYHEPSAMLNIKQLEYQNNGPINVSLDAAQCLGISGASGSGKSLLLRAIADLDEHKGEVTLLDESDNAMSAAEWRTKVAMLPADSQWWFDTVGEHFKGQDQALFKSFGFDEKTMSWSIARISSGEKQRLALLRLLENKPNVLLLDEPTANLDKNNTLIFESVVKKYLNETQACAIWVSHDLEQLDRVSNFQCRLESGQLVSHTC